MINHPIADTRETLIKDTDLLKKDAGKIVEDVKRHAYAHVDVVKTQMKDTFDLARDFVKERPFQFAVAALFIGFLIGTFHRK
jgi:ElaB/YqjD/DUF883 family membrane-anchored ribosome-binding protein